MSGTGVLVVGEVKDGCLDALSREVLAAGAPLARSLGKELSLVLLGQGLERPAQDGTAFGADRVYLIDHPLVADPTPDVWVGAMEQACHRIQPDIVLLGRSVTGRDLAPRLAFRLGVGSLQDCVELRLDPETHRLAASRPVYGGNVAAVMRSTGDPQIATVRPRAYEPLEEAREPTGEVVSLEVQLAPEMAKSRLLERREEPAEGVRLENARVVVAGGRGMGGREGFRRLEELATLLGGAVGCTRVPVDMGWAAPSSQIGLTGKTVTPNLYIAVGISGASQHTSGISVTGATVAINTDSEARMFDSAAYGVVGDWRQVLPAFIEAVREFTAR